MSTHVELAFIWCNHRFQVPSGVSSTSQSPGDDDYELAHMLYIGAANLTSLNASVIHIAVSDAGQ